MIVWVIAGLLGVATGLRVGWALVNKQSVVSAAMMLALGSLGFVAALNWQPLTLLVDTLLRWPNISIALSQIALTLCAAASCVMITSAASAMKPDVTRRLALANYGVATVITIVSVALFFADGRQPEMAPQEYLRRNLNEHTSLPWLLPLLYMLLVLTVVLWAGMRYSNTSRRGRALFLFSIGIGLLVLTLGFFLLRAVGSSEFVGVGSAITLLACAMLIVHAIAKWIHDSGQDGDKTASFPGVLGCGSPTATQTGNGSWRSRGSTMTSSPTASDPCRWRTLSKFAGRRTDAGSG